MSTKYRAFVLTIIVLLFDSCDVLHVAQKCKHKLSGQWISAEETINYDILMFSSDKNAVFTSRGDTIFRYKYSLNCKNSSLVLRDIYGNKYVEQIKFLSKDSLVFEGFFHHGGLKKYYKKPGK
jgi:hypothetical protein